MDILRRKVSNFEYEVQNSLRIVRIFLQTGISAKWFNKIWQFTEHNYWLVNHRRPLTALGVIGSMGGETAENGAG